jgi:hypothetical protein
MSNCLDNLISGTKAFWWAECSGRNEILRMLMRTRRRLGDVSRDFRDTIEGRYGKLSC